MRELLDRTDSRELSEWMEYYRMEPFGVERDNLHAGLIASLIYNAWKDKSASAKGPADFMYDFDKAVEATVEQTEEDMKRVLLKFTLMAGGAANVNG